ncbi:hypothetical protein [Streptomyces sp. NPDC058953]|uniref:hypothetical protein n=1 Tax=unclassified Streptomyces TaxID=2593676 RepID=UPI0036A2A67B
MRRRQKAVIVVTALCLGGALTACGGSDDDGYAAVGPAGPGGASQGAVPPKGGVTLLPLRPGAPSGGQPSAVSGSASPPSSAAAPATDPPTRPGPIPGADARGDTGDGGAGRTNGRTSGGGTAPGPGAPATTPEGPDGPQDPGGSGGSGGSGGTGGSGGSGGSAPPGGSPPPAGTPTPKPPPGPAVIAVGDPVLAKTDRRWCERVTVELRNTGGRPATAGTVVFETHIIGALGFDWATVTTRQALPAPIAPGTVRDASYTVCVDSWRVPLGMRIETQDVTADWT